MMQKRRIGYFIRIVPFSDDDDDGDNRIEKNDEKVRDIKILTKGNRDSEVKKLIKMTSVLGLIRYYLLSVESFLK